MPRLNLTNSFFLIISTLFILPISCIEKEEKLEDIQIEKKSIPSFNYYQNIELNLIDILKPGKIAFSTDNGKTFSKKEINNSILNELDIISFSNKAFVAFRNNSNSEELLKKGTRKTKIQHTDINLNSSDFYSENFLQLISTIKIKNDEGIIPISILNKNIILFETIEERKGAILIKDITPKSIFFDVKIEK